MRTLIVLIAVGATLMAAPPVAKVDSGIAFTLRGKVVPVSGAGGWAVFQGDQLATQEGSALLTFKDGSHVLVARESAVQVMEKGGKVSLKVVKGEASFKLKAADSIAFYGAEKATARVGMVKMENGAVSTAADAGYFGSQNGSFSNGSNDQKYGESQEGTWEGQCPEPISKYHKPKPPKKPKKPKNPWEH